MHGAVYCRSKLLVILISSIQEVKATGNVFQPEQLRYDNTTNTILNSSLRHSTRSKYLPYQRKWEEYCKKHLINSPNVYNILDFLSAMFNNNASYSTINCAKCALGNIINIPPYKVLSDHPLIAQYCKGQYNLRPPQPKLSIVWDVKIVFDYLTEQGSNVSLSDKTLSHKLLILLLLLGGQRMNTIASFQVDKLLINSSAPTFAPGHVLKHSRAGQKLDTFTYRAYPLKDLCVVDCLAEYLKRRSARVNSETKHLFITYGQPYKAASIDTLRRWVQVQRY